MILPDGKGLIEACGNIIDFAFIDSGEADVREAEIKTLIPFLKTNCLFALHDTAPQHRAMHDMAQEVELP